MFKNYLITALRNFSRHKLYSFINIAGLTVGICCVIFIILFVRDQLSYDRWIPDTDHLYRVEQTHHIPGQPPAQFSKIPYPAVQAMLEQIPEVRARTRLLQNQVTVLVGNRQFPETVDSVDPNFFQVIKLPLAAGNPASVFAEPNSIVLSETRAHKYFGNESPLGKTILISASYCDDHGSNCQPLQYPLVVTGILRDLPHNTQMAADLVMPNTSKADPTPLNKKTNWMSSTGWGYVVLQPGADPSQVGAKLMSIIDQSIDVRKVLKLDIKGSKLMSPRLTFFRDDHLSSDQYGSMTTAGSWTTVYGFAAIGVLILLVACFNFTNLATARAIVRAREISLRKVLGASRGQLIIQFLSESVLTSLVSLALALALSEALMPLFDRLVSAPIELDYIRDWPVMLSLLGIGTLIGLLSGVYPALILSGVRPGLILRTNRLPGSGSSVLRTSLIVLQFAVSIGLGIVVLVVFNQISYARHIDLGVQKDGVLVINGGQLSPTAQANFAKALRANPDVTDVAVSNISSIPFAGTSAEATVSALGNPSTFTFLWNSISPSYTQVYGIRLLAGRFLSEQRAVDTAATVQVSSDGFTSSTPSNILVNEAGARMLGYSVGSAVGKTVKIDQAPATIVGVIANTKMEGANGPVRPTVYWDVPFRAGEISVRVRGEHLSHTLTFIDQTWHAFASSSVINRHFLNDDFENQFLADERQGNIFGLFVGIAIFIACLGLFGLATFSTEWRTKEIGIRKVFGGRTKDIIFLLLWHFSIPVLIANVIAWPVAYYYLNRWLEGFADRVNLNPLYFISAGIVALIVAWATVIAQVTHVARANPIHALRHE